LVVHALVIGAAGFCGYLLAWGFAAASFSLLGDTPLWTASFFMIGPIAAAIAFTLGRRVP